MSTDIIKWNTMKTTDWSGGTTTEVRIAPEGASVGARDFSYRISSATCDLEVSEFSDYTGFTRYIAPVDGSLRLNVEGEELLLKKGEVYRFSGSAKVTGLSKVRDYNLILKDGEPCELHTALIKDVRIFTPSSQKMVLQSFDGDFLYRYGDEEGEVEAYDALVVEAGDEYLHIHPKRELILYISIV